jgi:hypothetical protein
VVGVRVGEQQVQLSLAELPLQGLLLGAQLGRQLLVLAGQLGQLDQVAGALLQAIPGLDLLATLGSLASETARRRRIVPGAWQRQLGLQLIGGAPLPWEVKDAPSARGSAAADPLASFYRP